MTDPIKDFNPADYVPPTFEDASVDSAVVTAFAAKVDETYRVNGSTDLKLLKAEPSVKFKVAPGQQPPADIPVGVSLVFEGPDAAELPEGTYLVEGDGQTYHLHLTPILSATDGKQCYQAVYND